MSNFTELELAYLASQRLGRLATIDSEGMPQNAPVGFRYNPELDTIDIGGHNLSRSKKFRNLQHNPNIAFVVDDVLPPWQPRAVEIRGTAQALEGVAYSDAPGSGYDNAIIRITPTRIISWGLEGSAYKRNSRTVSAAR